MVGITVKKYIEIINKTNLNEKDKQKRIKKAATLLTSSYKKYNDSDSVRKSNNIKIFFDLF